MIKGCHSCQFSSAVHAGAYANTEWKDLPCAKCDVERGLGGAVEYNDELCPAVAPDTGSDSGGECLPLDVMRQVVTGLLTLSPELRDTVAWRFAGLKYGDIALAQGVTMACAEKRHRRAMQLWPELKALFPDKVARRKRRRRKAESRMELEEGALACTGK